RQRVSMLRPAFDAQYEAQPGPACQAFVDETLTIAPRRSTRCGSAARASRNGPVKLILTVASQPAGVSSPTAALSPTPWLHTRTSRPPNAETTDATAVPAPSGTLTSAAI